MTGLTDYITESNWVDIFTICYVLVDDAYQHLVTCLGRPLRQCGPEPTFYGRFVLGLVSSPPLPAAEAWPHHFTLRKFKSTKRIVIQKTAGPFRVRPSLR